MPEWLKGKGLTIVSVDKDVELSSIAGGHAKWHNSCRRQFAASCQVKHGPATPTQQSHSIPLFSGFLASCSKRHLSGNFRPCQGPRLHSLPLGGHYHFSYDGHIWVQHLPVLLGGSSPAQGSGFEERLASVFRSQLWVLKPPYVLVVERVCIS